MSEPKGIHHLLLQTTDLDRAEEFYLGFLGFTVKKREQYHDGRPLTVTNEGLGLTNGASGRPGAVVEHIAFRSSDIRELSERALASGIEVIKGPIPGAYGLSVYLADPDGNTIELFSERED